MVFSCVFYHLIPLWFLTQGTSYIYRLIPGKKSASLLKLSDIQGFGRCSQCPSWTNFALCRAVSWFDFLFFIPDRKWQKNLIQFVSEACTVPYIDQKQRKKQTNKNSLELSASFIKNRFHGSTHNLQRLLLNICFCSRCTKMWGSSTLQTWTTLGILPWPSCGIFFRSLLSAC